MNEYEKILKAGTRYVHTSLPAIDWSNRVLYDFSYSKVQNCTYCKQEAKYDKNDQCKNCGATRKQNEIPQLVKVIK